MAAEKYEYGIDFDRIAAIDIHTHVEVDGHGHKAYDDEVIDLFSPHSAGKSVMFLITVGKPARRTAEIVSS